jgi:hypothetical protein
MRPLLALLAVAVLVPACGGSSATITERLWVSGVPKNPKARIRAFATTRSGADKFIGAFYSGSVLRGGHDVFEWHADGKDAAKLVFLQDGTTRRLRFETCEPSGGFDYCILVHGDPGGAERFQSRKRWQVKRPGRRGAGTLVFDAMTELAGDDDDLAAALAAGDADAG